MRVLGIMASPFKEGNSDILLDKALEGCKSEGASVEKIYLAEEGLPACKGCFACKGKGECVTTPEINYLLNKIRRADALLISTPVWWYSYSSYLKLLIDHLVVFVREDYSSTIAGKKVAVIAVSAGGDNAGTRETIFVLKKIFEFLELQWIGELRVINSAEHGEVKQNLNALTKAYNLGASISAVKI